MRTNLRVIVSFVLAFAGAISTGAISAPANASQIIIDTVDGSTIIGDYTFTVTIPQLDSRGGVRLQIVDQYGHASYGIVPVINVQAAGPHTYTIDPYSTIAEALTRLPSGSSGSNATWTGTSLTLRPGVNQIFVDYWDDTYMESQSLLTNVTFKRACAAGTYSIDGGVPLTGSQACEVAEPGTYVPSAGLTTFTDCPIGTFSNVSGSSECRLARVGRFVNQPSAWQDTLCEPNTYQDLTGQNTCKPCPTSYTSAPGSVESSDCIAPIVSTTPAAVKSSPTVAIGKKFAAKSIASEIGMTVPAKAKVTLKVSRASKKICKVSGSSIKGLKPGACVVTVKVKPIKGSTTTQVTTLTVS